MKKFKTILDIEDEARERNRQKFKEEVTEDIKDVWGSLFKPPKKEKKRMGGGAKFLISLAILMLGLIALNFILGNIWLLIKLLKYFFGI